MESRMVSPSLGEGNEWNWEWFVPLFASCLWEFSGGLWSSGLVTPSLPSAPLPFPSSSHQGKKSPRVLGLGIDGTWFTILPCWFPNTVPLGRRDEWVWVWLEKLHAD